MKTYITNPYIDDICELGKIISLKECTNCKYCKELHKKINMNPAVSYYTYLEVKCDYENNTISY